jgi:hypothetical protein
VSKKMICHEWLYCKTARGVLSRVEHASLREYEKRTGNRPTMCRWCKHIVPHDHQDGHFKCSPKDCIFHGPSCTEVEVEEETVC